ncbi:HdeD family acid-resistance protein [Sneathiella sp.]|uniref:HdeD family acid-resistance protein n=1 Tax=Sneathiella sp. TaxID=1964365 RepID=UPI00356716EC
MSDGIPPEMTELRRNMAAEFSKHWKFFLFQGIVLGVLGVMAIVLPQVATVVVAIFVGWLFFIGGIVRGLTIFRSRTLPGTLWSALAALLAIVLGLLLILQPLQGVLTLTMVLIAIFIVQGIVSVVVALQFRTHLRSWVWTLLSGIVDLVLAYMIWSGWPGTASWAIGLLVGINMLFAGMALISTALSARAGTPG